MNIAETKVDNLHRRVQQLESQLAAALEKNEQLEQRINEVVAFCIQPVSCRDSAVKKAIEEMLEYIAKLAAPVINQQPTREPDTRESREAEIDKERHHGY